MNGFERLLREFLGEHNLIEWRCGIGQKEDLKLAASAKCVNPTQKPMRLRNVPSEE